MSVRPRTLLLDALGTLVRLEAPAPRLRAELAQRFGVRVSVAQAEDAMSAEIRYYRAHLNEGGDAAGLAALRGRCAEVLRAALPQSQTLSAVARPELERALLSSLRFTAYDDALAALSALHADGVTLVVISNWDLSLHDVLERVGLSELLSAVVTSAEAGWRKPSPEIFTRGLALAGSTSGEAMHVGDSEAEDVIGARAAGIEPILISRSGEGGPEGVRTIRALTELI